MLRVALAYSFAVAFSAASGQDVEYIRALERAQQHRPATITSSSRIAPPGERGTPMILKGRVVDRNGAPAPGTIVFAYHTDHSGLYDQPGAGAHSWRLKGWAKADGEGRFTFQTIRPGPYPQRDAPAHVHFTVFVPTGERYHGGEVKFDDDPLVPEHERDLSKRASDYGEVRTVRHDGGAEHVEFTLRVDPDQRL